MQSIYRQPLTWIKRIRVTPNILKMDFWQDSVRRQGYRIRALIPSIPPSETGFHMQSLYKELAEIPAGSVMIEGMLELPKDPIGVVLFAHGSGSSRFSPRNNFVAEALHEAHIGTFLLDLLTEQEDRDVEMRFNIALLTQRLDVAFAWLRQHEHVKSLPLGLFGASTGAAAALQLGAKRRSETAAIVSRGGRPDLAGRSALADVQAPTLLIVGELDEIVVELNHSAYASLHCEKRLAIVSGATHLFEEPGALNEVAALSTSWFVQHFPAWKGVKRNAIERRILSLNQD